MDEIEKAMQDPVRAERIYKGLYKLVLKEFNLLQKEKVEVELMLKNALVMCDPRYADQDRHYLIIDKYLDEIEKKDES